MTDIVPANETLSPALIALANAPCTTPIEPLRFLLDAEFEAPGARIACNPALAAWLDGGEGWLWSDARRLLDRLDDLARVQLHDVGASVRHDGQARAIRLRIVDPAQPVRTLEGSLSLASGGDGAYLVAALADVSASAREFDLQKSIAEEMVHRVKNSISMAHALFKLTARESSTIDELEASYARRLLALAGVDTLILDGAEQGLTASEVIHRVFAILPTPYRRRVELTVDPVRLPPRFAQSFALAFNELGTNAIKHGALSRDGGTVRVQFRARDDAPGSRFSWIEEGAPADTMPGAQSAGMRLLTTMMAASGAHAPTVTFVDGNLHYGFTTDF